MLCINVFNSLQKQESRMLCRFFSVKTTLSLKEKQQWWFHFVQLYLSNARNSSVRTSRHDGYKNHHDNKLEKARFMSQRRSVTISTTWRAYPTFFKLIVYACNPFWSSPSLTTFVPLWFSIISLVFFYRSELLSSGFLQFKDSLVRSQNISKHRWLR